MKWGPQTTGKSHETTESNEKKIERKEFKHTQPLDAEGGFRDVNMWAAQENTDYKLTEGNSSETDEGQPAVDGGGG